MGNIAAFKTNIDANLNSDYIVAKAIGFFEIKSSGDYTF